MSELKRLVIHVEDASVLRAIRPLIVRAGFEVLAFDRPNASTLPKNGACHR